MPLSNVPVYENHVQTAVGELPPYIYHTPNPVPELISPRNFSCHWHEGVEILTMVEGTAQIMCDSVLHTVSPGETVVIHANQLHTVDSPSPGCRYHCLILERDFCAAHGIDILAARWTPQFTDVPLAALMDELLRDIAAHNLQKRTVAFMENGTWAPVSARQMAAILAPLKNMTVLEQSVAIRSSLTEGQLAEIEALADVIAEGIR